MKDGYTKIIQVEDLANAHVIKSFLESNAIPVFIEHEELSFLKYAIPINDSFIDISVGNDFIKKSLVLLNEQAQNNSGKIVACSNCGEENYDNFLLCWNCNFDLKHKVSSSVIDSKQEIKKSIFTKFPIYLILIIAFTLLAGFSLFDYYNPEYNDEGKYYVKLAIQNYYNKDYTSALEYSNRAIDSNPRVLQGYHLRANMLFFLKDYNASITAFSKIINMSSKDSDAYFGRGNAFCSKGEYDKGIEDVKKSIKITNNDVDSYILLGHCYFDKNDFSNALLYYSQSLKLDDKNNSTYYNIACVYSILNNKKNALEYLEKSIKLGFNDKKHIINDKDLKNIRNTTKYLELIRKLK